MSQLTDLYSSGRSIDWLALHFSRPKNVIRSRLRQAGAIEPLPANMWTMSPDDRREAIARRERAGATATLNLLEGRHGPRSR